MKGVKTAKRRDSNYILMKKSVTAIFDIGKTNKKFFLFDTDYREVYREYVRFDEIEDEDGFPSENLQVLTKWCTSVFKRILAKSDYDIRALNFSCYGASLVHIDNEGNALTPLYNYLKPIDEKISNFFYKKYGPEDEFSRTTGSLNLGMLNTGMHLYWLKKTKPEVFEKIKYSMHLPQYLSFIFTGKATGEHTNIGCHTILWDYDKRDYHQWVYDEKIDKILPPIVSAKTTFPIDFDGKIVAVGVGIHDSSSSLVPYLQSVKKPFVLISTGTWSISINPFTKDTLTISDIQQDCIYNMQVDGSPVRASRLFLGNEYKLQLDYLSCRYHVSIEDLKSIKFSQRIFDLITNDFKYMFNWEGLIDKNMPEKSEVEHENHELAYHQLMLELVLLQLKSLSTALGSSKIKRLYVDGGFSDNAIYIHLLSHYLKGKMKLRTTDSSLGSALGAAMVISDAKPIPKFLNKIYSVKKHSPTKSA